MSKVIVWSIFTFAISYVKTLKKSESCLCLRLLKGAKIQVCQKIVMFEKLNAMTNFYWTQNISLTPHQKDFLEL